MIPNALLKLHEKCNQFSTLCLAYDHVILCYFEPINVGRKVLLINRVVTFIPPIFGVHFKQEMRENTTHALGKAYAWLCYVPGTHAPISHHYHLFLEVFRSPRERKSSPVQRCYKASGTFLWGIVIFPKVCLMGLCRLRSFRHLRYDGQKKNSKWGIAFKAVGNSTLA